MKRFVTGDKLRLSADQLNAWTDAAEVLAASGDGVAWPSASEYNPGVVLVKNASGEDIDRFSVLGVDDVVYDATDNADEFKTRPALVGETPAADSNEGKIVVTLEPIDDGAVGLAVAAGVVPCRVDIQNIDDRFAELADGEKGYLISSNEKGSATILYAESGTGEKWAIVRIGDAGQTIVEYCSPTSTPSAAADFLGVDVVDGDGDDIDSPAETLKLFGRADRGSTPFDEFAWTDATILTFVRFPVAVFHEGDDIDGVIVGFDRASAFELEYCSPSSTPSSAADFLGVDVVDKDGGSIGTSPETLNLFGRADRGSTLFDEFGWTTSTILTFVRFPETVSHEATSIDGVIVGFDPPADDGDDPADASIIFDEWFDIQGDEEYFDIDSRDWSGRFIMVAAMADGSVPINNGSWDEQYIKHRETEFGAWTAQESYKWFRLYLNSNSDAQEITKYDSGEVDIYVRMDTNGRLQLKAENYYSTRTQFRISIHAGKRREASDAIPVGDGA